MANLLDNAKNNITNVASDFSQNVNNSVNTFSTNVSDIYSDSASSLDNFAGKNTPDSNSIFAKFAFLIFMLIFFIIIMKIIINLIIYLFKPSNTPTIVSGTILGTAGSQSIEQNPNVNESIPILRSQNDDMGIEFTWSTWLNINQRLYSLSDSETKPMYAHVFNKGETHQTPDENGIFRPNNCPGVYLNTKTNQLLVLLTTFNNTTESIIITDMPVNKWFNLIIRVEQLKVDIFINGKLAKRHLLTNVPKQNYGNIQVFKKSGTFGVDCQLSELRYFDYSVNLSEVQNIISEGPNLALIQKQNYSSKHNNYLSTLWYLNEF